jgi:pimeloyl-ACP methyl ester carboxylesterase
MLTTTPGDPPVPGFTSMARFLVLSGAIRYPFPHAEHPRGASSRADAAPGGAPRRGARPRVPRAGAGLPFAPAAKRRAIVTTRRAWVGGIEIVSEDLGTGERPLVLVHGFMGSRRDFETQWDALAALGRVLAPDLRGHGESTKTGDASGYTLPALAEDLLGWLDARGVARCDLLGHSMGGMLALRLALAHPARLASLVLMSTSARPLEHVERSLLEKSAALAREAGMEALFQVMRARMADDPARPQADRRVEQAWGEAHYWAWRRARLVAMDPQAYAALGLAMREAEPLVARLGEIACPTLVLVGAEDTPFLVPSQELAAGIPGARLEVLPGAAHQPQHEAPAAFFAALRQHLAAARGAT